METKKYKRICKYCGKPFSTDAIMQVYCKGDNGKTLCVKLASKSRSNINNLIKKALEKGVIKKTPCVFCGLLNVEGHHEDYTKPLDLVWMCIKHHRMYHTQKVMDTFKNDFSECRASKGRAFNEDVKERMKKYYIMENVSLR
jgi:hypothetical protein